jgi:hypothetical protein
MDFPHGRKSTPFKGLPLVTSYFKKNHLMHLSGKTKFFAPSTSFGYALVANLEHYGLK